MWFGGGGVGVGAVGFAVGGHGHGRLSFGFWNSELSEVCAGELASESLDFFVFVWSDELHLPAVAARLATMAGSCENGGKSKWCKRREDSGSTWTASVVPIGV